MRISVAGAAAASAVLAAACASDVPSAIGDDHRVAVTRISLQGKAVNGALEALRGRVLIRTPVRAFRRTNRDASPSARFIATATRSCEARVIVGTRAVATRQGPVTQTRRPVKGTDAVLLGSGRRPGGAWSLIEIPAIDPGTYEPTGDRRLYGLAAVRLATRRWIHVRAFADFRGSCTERDTRNEAVAKALRRLLRAARVEARTVGLDEA
jgi:hypothetical protein